MPDAPPRGLLLVNLGTPAAPTAEAVRAYLREFLTDKRVVQIPHLLWKPLLDWVILPRRSPVAAAKYAQIWLQGRSPLLHHSLQLAEAVQAQLPDWHVAAAMRYGEPALAAAIDALVAQGVRTLTVLPLYPQYSTTTTAAVEDVVDAARRRHPGVRCTLVRDYHADPHWVAAVADSIRAHWAGHGRADRLLLSFHGLPQRLVDAGDPYADQCEASTRAIAQALGIARQDVLLTYQSRFGRERWLQPYTQPVLEQLAGAGVRSVDIACPGFAVDCLETLEEIQVENAQAFRAAGGTDLRYIPCLNAGPAHARALARIACEAA